MPLTPVQLDAVRADLTFHDGAYVKLEDVAQIKEEIRVPLAVHCGEVYAYIQMAPPHITEHDND